MNNRPTTSKITTGLYMKPITVNDRKVSIFTGHDDKLNGTIGVNVVGSVPANANFSVTYPIKWVTIPTNIIQSWSIPEISDRLGLDTINSVAGEVFVQYYMIRKSHFCYLNMPNQVLILHFIFQKEISQSIQ